MLILGHMGLTLGIAGLLTNGWSGDFAGLARGGNKAEPGLKGVASLLRKVDYRLLALGSMLPDIIDKPVGQFLFSQTFSNGRIFGHTLLFVVALALGGVYLYQRLGQTWMLILSFGSALHLLLDEMWAAPGTLLWPLLGWSFEEIDLSHVVWDMLFALRSEPRVYVPEIVGGVILLAFALTLVRRKRVYAFVKNGLA